MRLVYPLALLALPVLAGCSKPAFPGCDLGAWRGGETTSVQYAACGGNMLVVVWSDISFNEPGFGAYGTSSVNPSQAAYSYGVRSGDGRAVELKVETTDGKAWKVTVNGTEYRREDGALFLVRTRGGAAQVKQVKHELSGLQATAETWERLAQENAEVKAFIAQAGAKE